MEEKRKYKLGEVVSWKEGPGDIRTIACMADDTDDWFQFAVHTYRGSDRDSYGELWCVWYEDPIGDDATDIRPASQDEVLELIKALICHGEPFHVTAEGRIILADYGEEAATGGKRRWQGRLRELAARLLTTLRRKAETLKAGAKPDFQRVRE